MCIMTVGCGALMLTGGGRSCLDWGLLSCLQSAEGCPRSSRGPPRGFPGRELFVSVQSGGRGHGVRGMLDTLQVLARVTVADILLAGACHPAES